MKKPIIEPPAKIPWYLKRGLKIADKKAGRDMVTAKLLTWFPKAAIASGVQELLVAHGPKDLDERTLKLIRVTVSFTVFCPFCIDMNTFEFEKYSITEPEIEVLQGKSEPESVETFSERERIAIHIARGMSITPPKFDDELMENFKKHFTEKEIVIVTTTAAQVNYWARLIDALGVQPAGFMEYCKIKLY